MYQDVGYIFISDTEFRNTTVTKIVENILIIENFTASLGIFSKNI